MSTKHNDVCIIGVLEIEERERKVQKKIFEKVMAKNFPYLIKYINLNIQVVK